MIAIVDGTGPFRDSDYAAEMKYSFCSQLKVLPNSIYHRGPEETGVLTRNMASQVRALVDRESACNLYVYLAGYSRGGAAAIQIAKWLAEEKMPISVKAMFLFDPVGMDFTTSHDGIPSNVANCYVIYRDTTIPNPMSNTEFYLEVGAGVVMRNPDFIQDAYTRDDRYARKSWGNCSVIPADPNKTKMREATIPNASHGAVGGVPWADRPEEVAATRYAAKIMNQFLHAEKLNVDLQLLGAADDAKPGAATGSRG